MRVERTRMCVGVKSEAEPKEIELEKVSEKSIQLLSPTLPFAEVPKTDVVPS